MMINNINSREIKIDLVMSNSMYYFYLIANGNRKEYPVALDSAITVSLLPSEDCEKCSWKFEPIIDNSTIQDENYTYSKLGIDYHGKLLNSYFTIPEDKTKNNFFFDLILFENISLVKEYDDPGMFSISFANKYIKQNFDFLSLRLQQSSNTYTMYLGDSIHEDIVKDLDSLRNFTVEYDNDEDPTTWYLQSEKLVIKNDKGENTFENQRISFDTTSWTFLIPQKFFFENLDKILYDDLGCQFRSSGVFICYCSSDFKEKFPKFTFYVNGTKLPVVPTDIMGFDGGSECYVYLGINYDNDYFVGGLNVLNNFFSIFNYKEGKLMLYDYESQIAQIKKTTPLVFFLVLFISSAAFILIYYSYRKFCSRNNQEFVEERNNNQIDQNDNF